MIRTMSHFERRPSAASGAGWRHQGGFIVTLELILIVTILVFGSLVGVVAVRDALFKYYVGQQSQQAVISDANGNVLGKAVDFDEHEAPRIFYIDRGQRQNFRALVGIRDDRFTGREPLYFAGASCQGDPCIKSPSNETADSSGVDGIAATGAVGYLYGLQGTPTYAIGPTLDGGSGLPGFLYRETAFNCPFAAERVGSRWISQKVVVGAPCETYTIPEAQKQPAITDCLVNLGETCTPPEGAVDQGSILESNSEPVQAQLATTINSLNLTLGTLGLALPSFDIGEIYCPAGTELEDDGNLATTIVYYAMNTLLEPIREDPLVESTAGDAIDNTLLPLTGELNCVADVDLKLAESVPNPNDPALNALEGLQPPFRISLPVDAGPDAWYPTEPNGEGGPYFTRP
tara:strand:- start:3963 stop:5171 length:1209 start_codon:yes stop_codon:yes gene_type:complete